MTGRLENKVAIVTGAARGSGEAIARRFVAERVVVIVDMRDDQGQSVADDLGDAAVYAHCDVTSEADWNAVVETAAVRFGAPNVLVNNAAVLHLATIADTTVDAYLRVFRANELGTFLGIRAVIDSMTETGGGSIVNISSIDGLYAAPFTGAYAASKFAVRGLAKVAALELGGVGIRVNCICPAAGNPEMVAESLSPELRAALGGDASAMRDRVRTPAVGRHGRVDDVAWAAVFLASDESSFCTGADLMLDGGVTAGMNIVGRGVRPRRPQAALPLTLTTLGRVGADDFDYELPSTAIAQVPAEPRDSARLLVSLAADAAHRRVTDLPDLLGPGDVLVVNDTRVRPARLQLRRATGGAVEVLLLEPAAENETPAWEALVRPSRKLPPGTRLEASDLVVVIGEQLEGGRRRVEVHGSVEAHGVVPLPPYIRVPLADPERYQTVYAREAGSVAAPTAGLHLTNDVLARCRAAGADVVSIDLSVGLDTFKPIAVDDLDEHVMHTERYSVPASTMEACANARRVVAVGTTTVRALESAARGELAGRTDLFIRDPFEFKVVDLLLTNFHFPRSTLLVLLDAFVGARWREVYALALAEDYRFLSFGDAMLVGRRSAERIVGGRSAERMVGGRSAERMVGRRPS